MNAWPLDAWRTLCEEAKRWESWPRHGFLDLDVLIEESEDAFILRGTWAKGYERDAEFRWAKTPIVFGPRATNGTKVDAFRRAIGVLHSIMFPPRIPFRLWKRSPKRLQAKGGAA